MNTGEGCPDIGRLIPDLYANVYVLHCERMVYLLLAIGKEACCHICVKRELFRKRTPLYTITTILKSYFKQNILNLFR